MISRFRGPVIYYGDEIGRADNIYLGDRNGVRTPISGAATHGGFSSATRALCAPIKDPLRLQGDQRRAQERFRLPLNGSSA